MSSVCSLFCRRLCTTVSATELASPNLNKVLDQLFKERDLEVLVEKFKHYSDVDRFRNKHRIYEVTVRRLAYAKRFSLIEEILEKQKQYNDISREGFAIRLISLYGKSSMFEHAAKTFDEMPQLNCERTVKSFNAVLTAAVDSKNFDRVELLFRELPAKISIKPNVFSYNIVIEAFCLKNSLETALSMLDEMENNDLSPNLITFNILLNGFYGDDRFPDGDRIWTRMEKNDIVPDIRSYNSKLRGLVLGKKMPEAVNLVEELGTRGVKPDIFTFNSLINGFRNDGNIEEAMRIYGELVKKDCIPDRTTFEILISCLCQKGDFDLAHELCKKSSSLRRLVRAGLVQLVVDGLVKESKIEEAMELVELGRSNYYSDCNLKMPSDE